MMIKSVIPNRVLEKRSKWATFEELHDTNDMLDEAVCILDNLKELLRQLPENLRSSVEETDAVVDSVMVLDATLTKCLETTNIHFEAIEMKLDQMHKSLLHDEVSQMQHFPKLASEVRCAQKRIDALISKAEDDIYKFLESEELYTERQTTDLRIMELVFNS